MIKERFKVFAAVYLLPRRNDKILLLHRYNTGWQDGNYSLVSGHIDGNESFNAAVKREAKEEAGIDIDLGSLSFVHTMHRLDPTDNKEYVDIYFTVSQWEGEIINVETDKCDDLSWFSVDQLPSNIVPSLKQAIELIFVNKYYSEYGWKRS